MSPKPERSKAHESAFDAVDGSHHGHLGAKMRLLLQTARMGAVL
jgi:hypothetical protein